MLRAGIAAAASSAMPTWLSANAEISGDPLLVVVFLRGAADGLHLVPPIGDPRYASARATLALSDAARLPAGFPGRTEFALHPALAPLIPLAERGELAIVHAAGSPEGTRSHFSAQDQMEAGRPGSLRTDDGWLARALAERAERGPFASLALGGRLPLSLRGSGSFSIEGLDAFGIPAASAAARAQLRAVYHESRHGSGHGPRHGSGAGPRADRTRVAGRVALEALDEFEVRLRNAEAGPREHPLGRRWRRRRALGGAGHGLLRDVETLARLLDAGLPIRAVCLESSGWDTHRAQGLEAGVFARRAADLGEALSLLAQIGRRRRSWLAVVMTEFGRTVKPNGSGGSDHGHGSVMLVAGSRVRAGVHGDWPGLRASDLYEGRDLAVATDYRNVLTEVLRGHLGEPPARVTFPGFTPRPVGAIL